MLEKNNIMDVMELLFVYPSKEFHIRGIARELKISPPTVLACIKRLKNDRLIAVKKDKILTRIKANLGNAGFVRKKRIYNMGSVYKSGIVDYLAGLYSHPKAIILFGSYSRGDDIEKSDIDIAILTKKHAKPDVKRFEKMLKRRISVHEVDTAKVSKEFLNNLFNGIVLEGSM